jgi:rubrerythrin
MIAANYKRLADRDDRTVAHFAALARADTIFGGASALTKAKHLKKIGGKDYEWVVSDVYARSTGGRSKHFEAWECPECGCAHLGQETAAKCCERSYED